MNKTRYLYFCFAKKCIYPIKLLGFYFNLTGDRQNSLDNPYFDDKRDEVQIVCKKCAVSENSKII